MSNEEEDKTYEYGYCSHCQTLTTVHACGQSWDEVKCGVFEDQKICKDCCYDYFIGEHKTIEDGCSGDCKYLEIPHKIMLSELSSFAQKEGYSKSDKRNNCFINKENNIMFGCTDLISTCKYDEFDEKKFIDDIDFYEGNTSLLIQHKKTQYAFDTIQKIKYAFIKLKENPEHLTYRLYDEKYLYIRGAFIWALTIPLIDVKDAIDTERFSLENQISAGMKLFQIEAFQQVKFDFSKMTPDDFEIFCTDFLISTKSYEKVERLGGTSGDDTCDIIALEKILTFEGEKTIRWLVQCKRYNKQNLTSKEVKTICFDSCFGRTDFDGVIIMTSTDVPSTIKKKIFEHGEIDYPKLSIKVKLYNNEKISRHFITSTDLLKKHSRIKCYNY